MNAHQRRKMKRFVNRLFELRDIKIMQYPLNFWQRVKFLFKPSGNEPGMKVTGKCDLTPDAINLVYPSTVGMIHESPVYGLQEETI